MIRQMRAGELGRTAIVLGGRPSPGVSAGQDDSVRVLEQRDGRLELEVETASGGLLVVSEVWHPGWRAAIEGRAAEVPVYRTNVSLMSLEVPAGRSRLRLAFRPLGWTAGVVASVATLAMLGFLAIRRPWGRA
jgi:uncharacterized membrane protein YfhO